MVVAIEKLPRISTAAQPLPEYGLFDLLRFLLASTVVLGHIGLLTWRPSADLAVQVFFALSGWLIGGILCRTTVHGLPRFYFNRSTRIWIPYFLCVAALYVVSYVHEPLRSPRWGEFLTYDLTFTHDWFSVWPNASASLAAMPLGATGNHFWSLAVEEQFYLVCPLVMLLPFGKRWWLWVAIAIVAVASAYYYSSITLGVLAAVLANKYPDWQHGKAATLSLISILALSVAFMVRQQTYPFAAPFFAISVVLLTSRRTRRIPLGRTLGGISFPLYLNAWVGLFAIHAIEKRLHLPTSMLLEFLAALAAGTVCYFLIDAQVMAKRGGFYRPTVGLVCGIVGYSLVIIGVICRESGHFL